MKAQHLLLCLVAAPIFSVCASPMEVIELEHHHQSEMMSSVKKSNIRKLQAAAARQACEEDKLINEENLNATGLQCRCEAVDGGITLICVDACAYCNPTETVCGINSAQAFYDNEMGTRTAIGGVFKYEKGLNDMVAVENVGCMEDDNGRIVSCETCNVYANNHKCNSCEFQSCSDGRIEEMIDCSNIEAGAVFDFCGNVTVTSGIFQTFSDNQFDECLPLSILINTEPTPHPTPAPQHLPPPPYYYAYPYPSSSKSSKKGKGGVYSKSAKKTKSRRLDG
ncbi:unnamed protein product [Cylindrotheca closterium]|uniref:Pectate lyase n=1 Tax=Cylindrotheca closterium TaxID=2856 RepID=A0AAD2CF93_9STRA|nr:unnamed protein product [Cylindrotheca closterium]